MEGKVEYGIIQENKASYAVGKISIKNNNTCFKIPEEKFFGLNAVYNFVKPSPLFALALRDALVPQDNEVITLTEYEEIKKEHTQ